MAIQTDIDQVFRGSRLELSWTLVPVEDMTGWTVEFNLAREPNSRSKIIDDRDCPIIDPLLAKFHTLLDTDDLDIQPGTYYWDVWRVDPGEEVILAYGSFVVNGDAKKPE